MRPHTRFSACLSMFCLLSCVLVSSSDVSRSARSGFEVTETTIAETQAAIREHRVTIHQLVEKYLDRIRAYDQSTRLNSIVVLNPEALADADRLDAEFARTGKLRPLQGVVMIIKDNYDTAGLQTTGGSLAMKHFEPTSDAFMVKRLRDAGAVILAKSNMAEWAFSPYVTVSSTAGITRNPYDSSGFRRDRVEERRLPWRPALGRLGSVPIREIPSAVLLRTMRWLGSGRRLD